METQIIFFRVQRKTIVAKGIENKECNNTKIQMVLVFLYLCLLYTGSSRTQLLEEKNLGSGIVRQINFAFL